MEFKSIDLLSITECCDQLNIRKEELPNAFSHYVECTGDLINLSETDRTIITRLSFLINADKDAFNHCSKIKHYQEYLISYPDGLYRDQAISEICKTRKNRKIKCVVILLIIFITILALICFSNYNPISNLSVLPETISLDKRGEREKLIIQTDAIDKNIFLEEDYSNWLSVERDGNDLHLEAKTNYADAKTTTVTIVAYSSIFGYRYNRMEKEVTVKQEPGLATYLRTNMSEINFDKWGQSSNNKVTIETDGCDIQVSQNGSWFAFTKELTSKGATTIATLTITAATNKGPQQSGDIIVTSNSRTQRISVFQESGLAKRFDLENHSITMAEEGSGDGKIYPIKVYTDGTFWSVKSAPSWLTACADMADKRLEISVGANNGDIKTGTIILESNNGHTRNITVTQQGDPTIFYADRSSIHFGTDTNSRTIYITNNSHKELQVVEDISWITTSLFGNELTVSCSKNKNNPPQYGVIHVKCGNKKLSINVKQDGWEKCRECGGDHKVNCPNNNKWGYDNLYTWSYIYILENGNLWHMKSVTDLNTRQKLYPIYCEKCNGFGEVSCSNSNCKDGFVKKTAQY